MEGEFDIEGYNVTECFSECRHTVGVSIYIKNGIAIKDVESKCVEIDVEIVVNRKYNQYIQ